MEPVSPAPVSALGPIPARGDLTHVIGGVKVRQVELDCLPALIELADNLASWSETVDGPLDYGDFEDLEQLGRRAHEIVQRLRPSGDTGDSRISERELDAALEELDRHAV